MINVFLRWPELDHPAVEAAVEVVPRVGEIIAVRRSPDDRAVMLFDTVISVRHHVYVPNARTSVGAPEIHLLLHPSEGGDGTA